MTLRLRLLLAVAGLSLLIGALGGSAFLANSSIEDAISASETLRAEAQLAGDFARELEATRPLAQELLASKHSLLVLDLIAADPKEAGSVRRESAETRTRLERHLASAAVHAWQLGVAHAAGAEPDHLQNHRQIVEAVAELSRLLDGFLQRLDRKLDEARDWLREKVERHYKRVLAPLVASEEQRTRLALDGTAAGMVVTASVSSHVVVSFAVACLILGVVAGTLLFRSISGPILKLKEASADLGRGDLGRRIELGTKDELGELAASFNGMAAQLQHGYGELEAARRRAEHQSQLLEEQAEAVAVARDAAIEAARLKSEFLANMSHEIRTPLNGVSGMIELLRGTTLDADQQQYVSLLRTSADGLLEVINDILDFSKIEAGKMELAASPFELRRLLGEALRTMAVRAHEKGLELLCEVPADVPEDVVGDATRLRQVVLNLVGNAIKFTERGEVLMRARAEAVSASEVTLRIDVSDTGIGVPQEKRAIIFDPFRQVDGTATRRYAGTGLGLAISSKLVESMGGRIGVESIPGDGSTFSFTVRLARPSGGRSGAPAAPPILRGSRVLVVDDNVSARRVLSAGLGDLGMRVHAVAEGSEVLSVLRKADDAREPFALAVVDAELSDVDGVTLARRVREDARLRGIRLLVLGAPTRPGDAQRIRELGGAAYLMKPATPSSLLDALSALYGEAPFTASSPTGVGRSMPSVAESRRAVSLRVLVGEDNPINRTVTTKLLEVAGHRVMAVDTGRKVLTALEGEAFDLALIDVQMPELDGFEVTAAIRERERAHGGHLPIIAVTAHVMKGYRERCLAAGMDGYVSKPIDASALMDAIEGATPGRRYREPELLGVATPAVFDGRGLVLRMGGDQALALEVAREFVLRAPSFLLELEEPEGEGRGPALSRAAHRLKGSLMTLGAQAAAVACDRLEAAADANELPRCEEERQAIVEEVQKLLDALRQFSGEVAA